MERSVNLSDKRTGSALMIDELLKSQARADREQRKSRTRAETEKRKSLDLFARFARDTHPHMGPRQEGERLT